MNCADSSDLQWHGAPRPFVLQQEPLRHKGQSSAAARRQIKPETRRGGMQAELQHNVIAATRWVCCFVVFFLPEKKKKARADWVTRRARRGLLIDSSVDWKEHQANPILLCEKRAGGAERKRMLQARRLDSLKENVNWSHPNLALVAEGGEKFN